MRIEFDVTDNDTRNWRPILDVLEQGTSFGLTDTAHGQIAWLRLEPESDDGHDGDDGDDRDEGDDS
ncbi:hypothetical protein OG787_32285 [Streptomyces sp. NBC_00075]|uniref:Uncharacterized protein n=1 Tax=Streptomyces sp. NBC_00093 TaxID=2975649 RepID=A0AAU2A6A1_9ACTN